ncbi:hypothetical protein GGR56DRAFT_617274 [Xylariaceae sp. FL0804]|nr:hypothetical protein GGR56DRAFT_617274 [Xylariaceae sp. FL0804]
MLETVNSACFKNCDTRTPCSPTSKAISSVEAPHVHENKSPMSAPGAQEVDEFGLPIRQDVSPSRNPRNGGSDSQGSTEESSKGQTISTPGKDVAEETKNQNAPVEGTHEAATAEETKSPSPPTEKITKADTVGETKNTTAPTEKALDTDVVEESRSPGPPAENGSQADGSQETGDTSTPAEKTSSADVAEETKDPSPPAEKAKQRPPSWVIYSKSPNDDPPVSAPPPDAQAISGPSIKEIQASKHAEEAQNTPDQDINKPNAKQEISEFSHQQLTAPKEEEKGDDDGEWQTMPAYARYDMYDDDDRLIAREHDTAEDESYGYAGLGGAGKGYTRVLDDEDAESETSMDDNTRYLFNGNIKSTSMADVDEEQRDAVSQLQATKDLLTEGQRIAYVGIVRLELAELLKDAESVQHIKKVKKYTHMAAESMKMWSQKIMVRLYAHMEISSAEQIMIEQLAAHGVIPGDLTPTLMQNARVKNPMAEDSPTSTSSPRLSMASSSRASISSPGGEDKVEEAAAQPPPAYEKHETDEMPEVRTPSQLPTSSKIDIDLRWTVLCDLFLVLIADAIYDARSRVLLERVGKDLQVPWIDICRFEKRITDALEMQQEAEQENWNEEEHLENRRKLALKRRYVMMGLATVGGGLVIGLSAGLLAPLIGAGLAAGFTTIGVGGTSSFLAGAGGAALISSGSAAAGGFMGGKAANRRTGAVKTFEYRPLHNNKRVNLILTISGWMTSKADDVRLPYSTVDPVMGDLYSILWEPEMLTSMGDTINILATEALTQGLQQVLGSTILIGLMAALQLPVVLSKLTYLIDNPWAVSLDRAWSAGLILADSLIDRNLGTRPITLVGYSLGSRVIFACLLELARKGAYGLVQNVYIYGSPVVVKQEEFLKARTVVSGRFLNGYSRTDWILGYLFRLTNGGIRRVAGLATVDGIPGLENYDCTDLVVGHMEYRAAMPRLLRESGWLVESDEFGEIEDPDPDQHREKQRELINEIEEARKELEKEGKANRKSGWGIFGRKKKGQREEWEVYEDIKGAQGSRTEDKEGHNHGVLFDVDAIRAELAHDGEIQVKELASTLPPMKLELPPAGPSHPRNTLRETKSEDGSSKWRPSSFENTTTAQSRTPDLRSGGGFDNNQPPAWPEDDHMQMSFDTSYRDPEPAWPENEHTHTHTQMSPFDTSYKSPEPAHSPAMDYHRSSIGLERPEMKSSHTTPNLALNDPWADDADDDDFGKEKEEISMSFA